MSLRVVSDSATPEICTRAAGVKGVADSYLERLVKMVPGEAVGAYPMLAAAAPSGVPWALPILAWVLLFVVIVLRWHATRTADKGPQWPSIIIAAVSFAIYVYVLDGDFGVLQATGFEPHAPENAETTSFLTALALVVWTILSPLLYRGDG